MTDRFPSSWTDPWYVSTVVGILAIGAVMYYAALVEGPPSPGTVIFVILAVFWPVAIAYEVALRWLN
jgi:hypothetical protein